MGKGSINKVSESEINQGMKGQKCFRQKSRESNRFILTRASNARLNSNYEEQEVLQEFILAN